MRFLISTSLVCVLAATTVVAAGAKTIYVQPGDSIQAAVLTAQPGDKVKVDAGTYNEPDGVLIATQNVEVVGEDGAIVIGVPTGTDVPIETVGFRLASPDDTVRGFTVLNYGSGIEVDGPGARVQDNTVSGCANGIHCSVVGDNALPEKSTIDQNVAVLNSIGISLDAAQNVTVTHNTTDSNSDTGILLEHGATACTVNHNESDGNGQYGIFVDFLSSANTLDHNTAFGNGVVDAEDELGAFGFPLQNDWDHNNFGTTDGI
jgi:parallel beta-helix repeat protein